MPKVALSFANRRSNNTNRSKATNRTPKQDVDHLEAALATAGETQDGHAGYLIEMALDTIRADGWPDFDPNLEAFRKGKRR